jgi:hypothetical protein
MRVPEDGRAPGADVIQQLVAIHRAEPCAAGGLDEERIAAHRAEGAHRRIDSARDVLQGSGEQGFGLGPQRHGRRLRGGLGHASFTADPGRRRNAIDFAGAIISSGVVILDEA